MPLSNKRSKCPQCGANRGLASEVQGDRKYCFACQYAEGSAHREAEASEVFQKTANMNVISGVSVRPIGSRHLTKETCERYGYGFAQYAGQEVQVANYYDDVGAVVAQKLRLPGKDFRVLGDNDAVSLWGKHCFRDKGRMVVICEGELDAMAVYQTLGPKSVVVSIPHGVGTAEKYIKREFKWLSRFQEVILCFDSDEPGQAAAKQCRALFKGKQKARIVKLPLKDPCEMLDANKSNELYRAIWDAQEWSAAGLVHGEALLEKALHRNTRSAGEYPWQGLNEMTGGLRYGELVTVCAGSGIGKSTVMRELAAARLAAGERVAYLGLEEGPFTTARGIFSAHANLPLIQAEDTPAVKHAIEEAYKDWGDRLYAFDSFGCSDPEEILSTIHTAAVGLDCKTVFLDHISMIVSGMDSDNERRSIDRLMHELRLLVETGEILLFNVSHLKRPMGKGHEEGAQVSLSHLRGSGAIAQLSDLVIGLERDGQADEHDRHMLNLRVLKNRFNGSTGPCGSLRYTRETGRLVEEFGAENFDAKEEVPF